MSQAVVVRYKTKPDRADENRSLIQAIFRELGEAQPEGLQYTAICLDDGVTFVHTAVLPEGSNPLQSLASFQRFTSTIGERCEEGPNPTMGSVVGSYPGRRS